MKKSQIMLGAAMGCFAVAVPAAEGLRLSGFLTASGTYADTQLFDEATALTDEVNPKAVSQDGQIENQVSFGHDSRFGLQIHAPINSRVSATAQLLAEAHHENYLVQTDWAFLTYRASDNVSVRFGKLKLTTFLVSDYIRVGYAYPWVRPPQEVYLSNPLFNYQGVDTLVRFNFGDYNLLVQPYFGNSRGDETEIPQEIIVGMLGDPPGTIEEVEFNTDSLYGFNLSFGSDIFTVRAGYLTTLVSAPDFDVFRDRATFASVGATLDWKNIVLFTEYFQREVEDVANLAFPNQKGGYATLGYRFGSWMPHVTFGTLDDNDNPPGGIPAGNGVPIVQDSIAVGLRKELGAGAALKIEALQVAPGVGSRGVLIVDPMTAPEPDDKVMIYTVAVDLVF